MARVRLNRLNYASSFVNSLFVRNKRCWLGVGGTSGGAVVALEDQGATISYDHQNSPIIAGVLAVAEDGNAISVATGAGLYQLANSQWKHFSTKNSQLPGDHLICLQAVDGKLYLGTLQNGMVEFRP